MYLCGKGVLASVQVERSIILLICLSVCPFDTTYTGLIFPLSEQQQQPPP